MKVVVTPEAKKAEAGQTSHTEAAEDHWIGVEAHGLSPSKAKDLTKMVQCQKL